MTFGDVVIRLACNMGQISECTIISSSSHGTLVKAKGTLGDYSIELTFHHEEIFSMECRTWFTPTMGIRQLQLLPELLLLEGGSLSAMKPGRLYLQQDQLRSGACLFDLADAWGTVFLFHDLGELSTFAEDTRTSLAGSVRVRWPEVGLYIRSNPEGNLKRGRKYIVKHFYLILEKGPVQCEKEASRRFVSYLARIYPTIRKPAVRQENFVSIAQGCIETLSKNHGCWQRVGKFSYLNAYLNDYATPPRVDGPDGHFTITPPLRSEVKFQACSGYRKLPVSRYFRVLQREDRYHREVDAQQVATVDPHRRTEKTQDNGLMVPPPPTSSDLLSSGGRQLGRWYP